KVARAAHQHRYHATGRGEHVGFAADRNPRATEQGRGWRQRVRARLRHSPGRRAEGQTDLRDHAARRRGDGREPDRAFAQVGAPRVSVPAGRARLSPAGDRLRPCLGTIPGSRRPPERDPRPRPRRDRAPNTGGCLMAVEPLQSPETGPPPTQSIYGGFAYFQGRIVPFADANVSVGTHALNYGTACFEGIRGYWNADHKELYLLKLAEHYQRFLKSTALLKIRLDESVEQLCELTREVIRRDGYHTDVYVRTIAYKASPLITVDQHSLQVAVDISPMPMRGFMLSHRLLSNIIN